MTRRRPQLHWRCSQREGLACFQCPCVVCGTVTGRETSRMPTIFASQQLLEHCMPICHRRDSLFLASSCARWQSIVTSFMPAHPPERRAYLRQPTPVLTLTADLGQVHLYSVTHHIS